MSADPQQRTIVSNTYVTLDCGANDLQTNLHDQVGVTDVAPADAMESLILALLCEGTDPELLGDAANVAVEAIGAHADDDALPPAGNSINVLLDTHPAQYNVSGFHASWCELTSDVIRRINDAHRALSLLDGVRSITIEAPYTVTWDVDGLELDEGVPLNDDRADFMDNTYIEVTATTLTFFAESLFGREGQGIRSSAIPYSDITA